MADKELAMILSKLKMAHNKLKSKSQMHAGYLSGDDVHSSFAGNGSKHAGYLSGDDVHSSFAGNGRRHAGYLSGDDVHSSFAGNGRRHAGYLSGDDVHSSFAGNGRKHGGAEYKGPGYMMPNGKINYGLLQPTEKQLADFQERLKKPRNFITFDEYFKAHPTPKAGYLNGGADPRDIIRKMKPRKSVRKGGAFMGSRADFVGDTVRQDPKYGGRKGKGYYSGGRFYTGGDEYKDGQPMQEHFPVEEPVSKYLPYMKDSELFIPRIGSGKRGRPSRK